MGEMEAGLIMKVEAGRCLNGNMFSHPCFQHVKMLRIVFKNCKMQLINICSRILFCLFVLCRNSKQLVNVNKVDKQQAACH